MGTAIKGYPDSSKSGDEGNYFTGTPSTGGGLKFGLDTVVIGGEIETLEGGAQTPVVQQVPCAVAGTEYSISFPDGTRKIMFKSRKQSAVVKYSWVFSQSGTNYVTIPMGGYYMESGLKTDNVTLYFQTDLNNNTLEVEYWTA